ncbi:hypothetical protein GDO86_001062 [Hymenochirus boettgeri]|uniref:Uncharacterized protein n=1 Tax=Hymenochirus boettgeri TaxID=247094 RepID=A0A8T2KH25_9PIPI|nr:hypothetical protein GDO86_001062 [Hymenochirus boettgeri]
MTGERDCSLADVSCDISARTSSTGEIDRMADAVVMQDSVEREGSGSLTGGEQVSAPQPAPCQQRQSRLPLSRVKALMKADPDVTMASQESVFVISKATVRDSFHLLFSLHGIVYRNNC